MPIHGCAPLQGDFLVNLGRVTVWGTQIGGEHYGGLSRVMRGLSDLPKWIETIVLTKLPRRIKDDHSVKALNLLFKEKYLTACNWSEYSNKPGNVSILVGVNLKEGRGVRSLSPPVGLCFLIVQIVGRGTESQEK